MKQQRSWCALASLVAGLTLAAVTSTATAVPMKVDLHYAPIGFTESAFVDAIAFFDSNAPFFTSGTGTYRLVDALDVVFTSLPGAPGLSGSLHFVQDLTQFDPFALLYVNGAPFALRGDRDIMPGDGLLTEE